LGCDLGDWGVTGEDAVVGLVTVTVLAGEGTGGVGVAAGCWDGEDGSSGGCTARYIFVGPNTPCLPVVACAIEQIHLLHFKCN
jgi:hypothetical protein